MLYQATYVFCPDPTWYPMGGVTVVCTFRYFRQFTPVCMKFIHDDNTLNLPESSEFSWWIISWYFIRRSDQTDGTYTLLFRMYKVFQKMYPEFCLWLEHTIEGSVNDDSVKLFTSRMEHNITLRHFWRRTRISRRGNVSRVGTGRRQRGRPHHRGRTWIESQRKGRISTGADHLKGYEFPSWWRWWQWTTESWKKGIFSKRWGD